MSNMARSNVKFKVMDPIEKRTIQKLHTNFVESLDPKIYVIDVLYSEEHLTPLEYENLMEISNRAKQCRELLMIVTRKCPMEIFLKALCHNNAHKFLADQVLNKLQELKTDQGPDSSSLENSRGQKRTAIDVDDESQSDEVGHSENKRLCPLCKCPPRINTMTSKKKLLTKMQQHLKYLCMDGKAADHNKFLERLALKWRGDADVQFVVLDAQARNMRVSGSQVSDDNDFFQNMERLIPYTTDPTTSSMTFLARKASVYDITGRPGDGLTVLGYAKTHADQVVPCRDTGLVIYMKINLLLKEFEQEPSEVKKNVIIERIKEAIEVHFSQEEEEVREDCSRMLYVKLACFYLGLGLMGNRIAQCRVAESDLKSAETVLERLAESWEHMDSRRKMFYYLAQAMLWRHRGKLEKALHHGEIAQQMAGKGQFAREMANIDPLTRDLAIELKQRVTLKGEDILKAFEDLEQNGEHVRFIPKENKRSRVC